MQKFKLFDFILNEEYLNREGVITRNINGEYLSEQEIINNMKFIYDKHLSDESKLGFAILAIKTFDHKSLTELLKSKLS